MNGQNEPTSAQLSPRFVLNLSCTEHMVSENIVFDDIHSVSSLVTFGNSGMLFAAHVGKLITNKLF